MLVSSPHSVTECPSQIATGLSMMEELENLLLNPMFAMPWVPSTCTFPRRPPLMAPNNPVASRGEVPPEPGETLQVTWSSHLHPHMSLHRQVWPMSQPIVAIPPLPHQVCQRWILAPLLSNHRPTPSTYQMMCYNSRGNEQCYGFLLTTRASLDTHCQSIISETEVGHHHIEINLAEAIREVKARYTATIGDTKSAYVTPLRRQRPLVQPLPVKQTLYAPLELGKQKLPMWCKLQNCNGSTRKPNETWKRRHLRWRSILTNPSCGPVEQPFKSVPMGL